MGFLEEKRAMRAEWAKLMAIWAEAADLLYLAYDLLGAGHYFPLFTSNIVLMFYEFGYDRNDKAKPNSIALTQDRAYCYAQEYGEPSRRAFRTQHRAVAHSIPRLEADSTWPIHKRRLPRFASGRGRVAANSLEGGGGASGLRLQKIRGRLGDCHRNSAIAGQLLGGRDQIGDGLSIRSNLVLNGR